MKSFKRIALIVASVLLIAGSANAKTFSFGIKAGANFNKLSFSKEIVHDINKANSTGWEAGVMVEANLPIVGLGVDLSLMYARMNNNGSIFDSKGQEIYDAGKNYLMLPLNIKYKISLPVVGKYLAPYVFTGPNFLFDLDKHTLDYIKNKKCQVAWNLGIGLEFFNHLQVGASYNFGLGKIGNSIVDGLVGTNQNVNYTVKNNYWMVTAAYLF